MAGIAGPFWTDDTVAPPRQVPSAAGLRRNRRAIAGRLGVALLAALYLAALSAAFALTWIREDPAGIELPVARTDR